MSISDKNLHHINSTTFLCLYQTSTGTTLTLPPFCAYIRQGPAPLWLCHLSVPISDKDLHHFNSATFLCLHQTRTCISIGIYRVLFVFNDLLWGGNLLVLLMDLLAIECCLNFIFINQLHKIHVISLVCFYVEYLYNKPYQMSLKDHKEETKQLTIKKKTHKK